MNSKRRKPTDEEKIKFGLMLILKLESKKSIKKKYKHCLDFSNGNISSYKKNIIKSLSFGTNGSKPPENCEKLEIQKTSFLSDFIQAFKYFFLPKNIEKNITSLSNILKILTIFWTVVMAFYTYQMVRATNEIVRLELVPNVNLELVIKTKNFEPKIHEREWVEFSVQEYKIHKEEISFYITLEKLDDLTNYSDLKITIIAAIIDGKGLIVAEDKTECTLKCPKHNLGKNNVTWVTKDMNSLLQKRLKLNALKKSYNKYDIRICIARKVSPINQYPNKRIKIRYKQGNFNQ